MRAAVTESPGGAIDVMMVPDPYPGPGEVVVTVHAASVNRLDRMVYEGMGIAKAATFPLIQGIDAAGVLDGGSRVVVKPTTSCEACRWCLAGQDADCARPRLTGVHRPGGFAEQVAVPTTSVLPIAPGMSLVAAAAAAHVYPVALRAIRASELSTHETVLVTGGAGSVGSAAIQLAGTFGARVLSTCSTEDKAEVIRRLGATPLVVPGHDPGPLMDLDAVMDATGGAGVDVVLDCAGDPAVSPIARDCLGRGGRFVVVGTHAGERLELDLTRLYQQRQRFIGAASSSRADFRDAYAMIAEHGLEPIIGTTFGLEEIRAALDSVLDRSRVGKTVVRIR